MTTACMHVIRTCPIRSSAPQRMGQCSCYEATDISALQLKQLLKSFEASTSNMEPEMVESFGKSVQEAETQVDALRRSWGAEMQSFAQLVAYLKGLKPSITPGELFQLIHSFLKHLEGAMADVVEAERNAARVAASPARTPGLPHNTPGQERSPMQVKEGVIQQMKALCRLTPEARRERIAQAGSERRLISENMSGRDSLQAEISSGPAVLASRLRQSKVNVIFLSRWGYATSFNCRWVNNAIISGQSNSQATMTRR